MDLNYIDTHCHVQFVDYDADRDAVIAHMLEAGVGGVLVGCNFESSRMAVELAEAHEHLFAAVGQHPNELGEAFDAGTYRFLADSPKCVAIGECGLDYFRTGITPEQKERQSKLFKQQIALAAELDKPLILHVRPSKGSMDAYDDALFILKKKKEKNPNLRGDAHFFAGDERVMREFVALGFTVSFTAVVTFARDYDAVIRATPLDSMLAETDAPHVAPVSRRGTRNDPLAVVDVVQKIAEVRGEEPERVREALLENTTRLFGIS